MKVEAKRNEDVGPKVEALRLELEGARRELERCRLRLAQVDEVFESSKRSEALLHGEKAITEMIARGDALEIILEVSCKLVEQALPGSFAIIMLLDGKQTSGNFSRHNERSALGELSGSRSKAWTARRMGHTHLVARQPSSWHLRPLLA